LLKCSKFFYREALKIPEKTKLEFVKRNKKLLVVFQENKSKKVEMAGVEPASESGKPKASTSVFLFKKGRKFFR